MATCKVCKQEFDKNEGSPWNKSICSRECVYQNQRENSRIQQAKKKEKIITRKCRECGKDVISTAYCPRSFCEGKYGQCYKDFLSKNRKGKNNPAYRNGFAIMGSRKYTGLHLRACAKYRRAFLEKHDFLFCEICNVNSNGTPKFEVHHIYYASLWPKHKYLHDFRNLILVCIGCHNKFHSSVYKEEFALLEKERGLKELFNESPT